MKDWNLRYASEMDEQTLNRLIPTTSSEIRMNPYSRSVQKHVLHKPVGNLDHIITVVGKYPKLIHHRAYMYENESTEPTGWGEHATEALYQHFLEEPIVLPNQDDRHHPDNHQHILHRVKSWIAKQV